MPTESTREIHPRTGATIAYYVVPYGKGAARSLHVASVSRGGQRWRFSASTFDACQKKVAEKLLALELEGSAVPDLSAANRRDALAAISALSGRASLAEAADFWLLHHPAPCGPVLSLAELADAYLLPENRPKGGESPSHLAALRQHFAALESGIGGDTPAASVMEGDLSKALNRLADAGGWSPVTYNNHLRSVRGLFAFADRKYKLGNPAAHLGFRKAKPPSITFFTPEEAAAILSSAEAVAPAFAAPIAILLFAGVRSSELVGQYGASGAGVIGGLRWEAVDIDGEIVLDRTKTNQRRTIPISPNLAKWLARYRKRSGRVVSSPVSWRRARAKIAAHAKVDWRPNEARHSFATYHFALHRNRDALEAAMGHTQGGAAVLERHYRSLARRADAERYWAISPARKLKR